MKIQLLTPTQKLSASLKTRIQKLSTSFSPISMSGMFLNMMNPIVDQILSLKKQNPEADTSALEAEIDKLVYEL